MIHAISFLIEPNTEALREFPLRTNSEMAAILLEPFLTSRSFSDSSSWRREEAETAVKLIYLARMREYTPIAQDSVASRVLGSDKVSVQLFDTWWSIRRLSMEEGRSEEMESFLVAALPRVESTGNTTVDMWVTSLAEATNA